MFGEAYGDACMPNWPHWYRTPLPRIATMGLRWDKHCIMLGDRIGNWSVPHFIKQLIAESGLTQRWQSFPRTFEQPMELFDTLQTRPTPFVTLYNHSPRIHFRAKQSLPRLLVFVQFLRKILENFENYFGNFGRIISRNSLKIIEKYFRSFRELFRKIF